MSQSPVKKETGVKKEPNVPEKVKPAEVPWQEVPLKLCSAEEVKDIRYHVMKFQSKQNVDICKNFTRPIRLHRKDPRNIQFQLTRKEIEERRREEEEARKEKERRKAQGLQVEEDVKDNVNGDDPEGLAAGDMDLSQVAPDGGARKSRKNMFKRKTRQINLMADEKRKLRYEEYYPWVIEDYDGKNVFVGNYEAGASDTTHVLFVFDSDGFKMVPSEKVYKFTPRNKYATLTLEEAEAKMEKKSSVPRWLMKHMEEGSSNDHRYRNLSASDGAVSAGGSRMLGGAVRGGILLPGSLSGSRKLRTVIGGASSNKDRDSDHDDLDFDEEFADDEEAPIMDGDEEENKLSEKKLKKDMLKATHFDGQSDIDEDDGNFDDLFDTEKSRKVDKEGEKLRKVLNKTEGGVYESDDDDKLNPYLSKSDLESDEVSDDEYLTQVKTEPQDEGIPTFKPRTIFANSLGSGFVVIKATLGFLKNFPVGEWNPDSKRKRPIPAAPESPSKLPKGDRSSPSPTPSIELNSSGPDGVLVTAKEVLDIVRENPLTTKDLLQGLKNRVNAHKENKQRIIAIVKQNLKLVDGKLVLKDDVK